MNTDRAAVDAYLCGGGFWRWQDGGSVIAWIGGPTIAFTEELIVVVERLASHGLPPLDSLVLLLGSLKDHWKSDPLFTLLWRLDAELSAKVLPQLNRLTELPQALMRSCHAKAELAAMVFEGTRPDVPPELARLVLQRLIDGVGETDKPEGAGDMRLTRALTVLRESRLDQVNEATLRLRLKTGLEKLVEAAPISAPEPTTGARDLMDALRDDARLGYVAHLARLLLAAVELPRPLKQVEELSVGGVSDIANRGPLDRLLLSELAHDDLTLAVRVSLGEALYLRRETPPRSPPRCRLLLIDAGIRMWGTPRVFAAAVALAIAARANERLTITAWRSGKDQLVPVELSTEKGLTALLEGLDHQPHPGAALAQMASQLEQAALEGDAVLVTREESLGDPDLKHALARWPQLPLFLATVSREGKFRLLERRQHGSRVIREATIDLDRILERRPKSPPHIERSTGPLPAIFHLRPFPLRWVDDVESSRCWRVGFGWKLAYTRDGRLLLMTSKELGGAQICDDLPEGIVHAVDPKLHDDHDVTVIGKLSGRGLRLLRVDGKRMLHDLHTLDCGIDTPLAVTLKRERVMVFTAERVHIFCAVTGEPLKVVRAPGWTGPFKLHVHWSHAPRRGKSTDVNLLRVIEILGVDGERAEIPLPQFPAGECVVDAWSAVGFDGPLLLTNRGSVYKLDGNRISTPIESMRPLGLLARSHDGRRFALGERAEAVSHAQGAKRSFHFVDLARSMVQRVSSADPDDFIAWSSQGSPRARFVVRRKHTGILITAHHFGLLGRRGSWWPLLYNEHSSGQLTFPSNSQPCTSGTPVYFDQPMDGPRGAQLVAARFPDGSRAVLDRRGLLHLQSSDPSLPECTLVLVEGEVAGWSSDGRMWGPKYFIHPHEPRRAEEIYNTIIRPFMLRVGYGTVANSLGG